MLPLDARANVRCHVRGPVSTFPSGAVVEAGLFAMRHGPATHNRDKVIASGRGNLHAAVLTSEGAGLVRATAENLPFGGTPVAVFAGQGSRYEETARLLVAHANLTVPDGVQVTSALTERGFGRLDGGPKSGYQQVYAEDHEPDSRPFGTESTAHVAERVGDLIAGIWTFFHRQPVVLVTSADVGEIAQAVLTGKQPNTHRQVPKLQTGEMRTLIGVTI